MKRGRMQAKDVPTRAVLEFLAQLPEHHGAGWHDLKPREQFMPTVLDAMPAGTPEKVALAKMRRLIAAGLVDGCGCGCRGDFNLTEKGRSELAGSTTRAERVTAFLKEHPRGAVFVGSYGTNDASAPYGVAPSQEASLDA